jgi:16S rRNA (cytidine1402-2'-O)-methyltransferase
LSVTLPAKVPAVIKQLDHFFVEDPRSARRFISSLGLGMDISSLNFRELNEHSNSGELSEMANLLDHHDAGIISEAGVPGIADPGADLVRIAHAKGVRVIPLVGPSSIVLALMASGLNGQSFAFAGYLPVKPPARQSAIKQLERRALSENQSQAFIETPYRNNSLLDDLLKTCQPNTLLCIAVDITLDSEFIQTRAISLWREKKPDLHKRPAIFILGS